MNFETWAYQNYPLILGPLAILVLLVILAWLDRRSQE